MKKVRLILLGGFLGSGKTTLMARAAEILMGEGKKVGLITNDQAEDLVDSAILEAKGFGVAEVAGGCFCCRFEDLIDSSENLIERLEPDVLIGEPVGSCTDISATVLQPLKRMHQERFALAPFTVLADPLRLREICEEGGKKSFPRCVEYIFQKQLEEADMIAVNKADLMSEAELRELTGLVEKKYPGREMLTISALTGAGVEEWLGRVLSGAEAGRYIAEVDYDTYAEGEACLGWCNAAVALKAETEQDWGAFCETFLTEMQAKMAAEAAEIAHAKLFIASEKGSLVANVTSNVAKPTVRSEVEEANRLAMMTLNARVSQEPEKLEGTIKSCLNEIAGRCGIKAKVGNIACFQPARPEPAYRMNLK